MSETEKRYLELLLEPLDKCAAYKPKFGSSRSESISLDQFKRMYGEDPFYHWIGLDTELMYAAHRAAGGMTSIYRNLGKGCERLIQAVIQDSLQLSQEQIEWSYAIVKKDTTKGTLTLDARIDIQHVGDPAKRLKFSDWIQRSGRFLGLSGERISQLRGAVFEVRQGYESADAKRSSADLAFGMNAASANYLPVFAIISTQTSAAVLRRYGNSKMLVLKGSRVDDDNLSTYAFFTNVIGYDLAQFFERNSAAMRQRCDRVLQALLSAKSDAASRPATAVILKKKRPS